MRLVVNGRPHDVPAEPARDLLAVLRDELELTGAKYGCGEGECGACTVLVGGAATNACTLALADVGDRAVTTIEGLAPSGQLHAVQRAFVEVGALQCGYCTPGMILAAVALLASNPSPSDDEIVRALDGNLCRCGGYPRIVQAVRRAAEDRR